MIKKAVIISLLIFLVYSLLIPVIIPNKQIGQHQWQGNRIKAQNFIYNDSDTIKSVIVGSSLSARILTDSLDDFFNLAFHGESVFDGLEILSKKRHIPDKVYIEINMLLKRRDDKFLASLFNPYTYYSQTYLPGLRAGKEPLAIAGAVISRIILSIFGEDEVQDKVVKVAPISRDEEDALVKKLLSDQVIKYSIPPDSIALRAAVANLTHFVEILKDRNVKVVFFEMPVDKSLSELLFFKTLRQTLHQAFPPNKFSYILQPAGEHFETSDGIHLTPHAAIKYTNYFESKVACNYCQQ